MYSVVKRLKCWRGRLGRQVTERLAAMVAYQGLSVTKQAARGFRQFIGIKAEQLIFPPPIEALEKLGWTALFRTLLPGLKHLARDDRRRRGLHPLLLHRRDSITGRLRLNR